MNLVYKKFEINENEQYCTYRNCKHLIKDHDGKKCKCKHRQSSITGIGFTPKYVMMWDKSDEKDLLHDTDFITQFEEVSK